MKPQSTIADARASTAELALGYARGGGRTVLLALGALTLLAAILRFSTLGLQSFWYDESVTAWLVHASPGKMLAAISRHETTPPTYYLLVWTWAKVFSNSEVGLRSLPALAGTLTVPAAYFAAVAGTRSRRIGLVAAALVATSPLLVWYSQEARPYSLLVLTTVVSLGFLARWLDQPRNLLLSAWAVCSVLALAVHYFAAFFIAAETAWLLVTARRRGLLKPALVAGGSVVAVEAALVPFALHQNDVSGAAWISTLSLLHRFLAVPKQFAVGLQSGFEWPAELVAAGLCLYALWLLLRSTEASERRGALLFGGLSAAAVALPLSLAAVGQSFLITRNVIAACVPFLLVLAVGFGSKRSGRPALVAAALLCALGVAISVSVFTTPEYQRSDWRGLGQTLGATQQPKAIALDYWALPLEYYLPGSLTMPPGGITVSELDVIAIHESQTRNVFCWWGARCNLARAVPPTNALPPGFFPVGSTRHNQFEILRFRSPQPVLLTPQKLGESSLGAPGITVLSQQPHPPASGIASR